MLSCLSSCIEPKDIFSVKLETKHGAFLEYSVSRTMAAA